MPKVAKPRTGTRHVFGVGMSAIETCVTKGDLVGSGGRAGGVTKQGERAGDEQAQVVRDALVAAVGATEGLDAAAYHSTAIAHRLSDRSTEGRAILDVALETTPIARAASPRLSSSICLSIAQADHQPLVRQQRQPRLRSRALAGTGREERRPLGELRRHLRQQHATQ